MDKKLEFTWTSGYQIIQQMEYWTRWGGWRETSMYRTL